MRPPAGVTPFSLPSKVKTVSTEVNKCRISSEKGQRTECAMDGVCSLGRKLSGCGIRHYGEWRAGREGDMQWSGQECSRQKEREPRVHERGAGDAAGAGRAQGRAVGDEDGGEAAGQVTWKDLGF